MLFTQSWVISEVELWNRRVEGERKGELKMVEGKKDKERQQERKKKGYVG